MPILEERFEAIWFRSYNDVVAIGLILNPFMYKIHLDGNPILGEFARDASVGYL